MAVNLKPKNHAAFERVHLELLDGYVRWAASQGRAPRTEVVDMAFHVRWQSADRDLGRWDRRHLTTILFHDFPLTVAADLAPVTIDGLHGLIDYLASEKLLHGADPPEVLHAFLDANADDFLTEATDPAHIGPGPALALAMQADGIDPTDREQAREWIEDFNSRPLHERDAIIEPIAPQLELPRVRLPKADELRAAAARSDVLVRLRTFVDFVGTGRKLTKNGNLTVADGRELSALLPPHDDDDLYFPENARARSSVDLPRVDETIRWARAAGFVRVVHGRVVATKRGQRLDRDPADDWERAFRGLIKTGVFAVTHHDRLPAFGPFLDGEVVGMLLHLYVQQQPVPVARIREMSWDIVLQSFVLTKGQIEIWEGIVHSLVERIIVKLDELGAVVRADVGTRDSVFGRTEPWGGTVELSGLGMWAFHHRLLEDGYDAPSVGELTHAPNAGLLLLGCSGLDGEAAGEEVRLWLDAHWRLGCNELAAELRTTPDLDLRMLGLHALAGACSDGERIVRELALEPSLRPIAMACLVARGLEPETVLGGDIGPDAMVETLATLLVAEGPEEMTKEFSSLGPPEQQINVMEHLWRSRSPYAERVLETVAKHHASKLVAKAARKALHRLRSAAR